MVVTFNCRYCDTFLKVPDAHRGKKVRCPECKLTVTVPEKSEDKQYIVEKEGGNIGPIKFIEVADMVTTGTLRGGDRVAIFGTDVFKPVKEYPEFAELARIAMRKAAKKTTMRTAAAILKLVTVAGLVAVLLWAKAWWDDRKIERVQQKVYKVLRKGSWRAIRNAEAIYKTMAADFPDHPRLDETKRKIEEARKTLEKRELAKYEKIKGKIEKAAADALAWARKHQFTAAYRLVREIRNLGRKCMQIEMVRKGKYYQEAVRVGRRYAAVRKEIDAIRAAYVKERLEAVDRLVAGGKFKEARDVLYALGKMDLGSRLSRIVTRKAADVSRKAQGTEGAADGGGKKPSPRRPVEEPGRALRSSDPEILQRAFGRIALGGGTLSEEERSALFSAVGKALGRKDLYFRALDALLVAGDPEGTFFDRVAGGYRRFFKGRTGKGKGVYLYAREPGTVAADLVSYLVRRGPRRADAVLADMLEFDGLSLGMIKALPGRVKDISAFPKLRKALEKIVVYAGDTARVKEAVRTLGKLKSAETLDILIMIVDYLTCPRCSFGGDVSGHTYKYRRIFCARCREKDSYSGRDSIFTTTIRAIGDIGGAKALPVLKKLREKERAAGHGYTAGLIGGVVEKIEE